MKMKRDDCYMTFSEALEQYLAARDDIATAPINCRRYDDDLEQMNIAKEHMDALTEKD